MRRLRETDRQERRREATQERVSELPRGDDETARRILLIETQKERTRCTKVLRCTDDLFAPKMYSLTLSRACDVPAIGGSIYARWKRCNELTVTRSNCLELETFGFETRSLLFEKLTKCSL